MNRFLIVSLFYSFLISHSCIAQNSDQTQKNQIDTEFFIPIERTNLYSRVVGNPEKPIIITLHGGPGAFNVDHEFYREVFENDYLMVYFDQRGSGKSDEFRDKTMFTTDQFVKDLDEVVNYIKEKYPNKKINLLGSSWGGMYGFLYLIKHQEKINSFICNSGTANIQHNTLALIKHEKQLANKLLKKTADPSKIERYNEILKKLDTIEKSGFDKTFFVDMNTIRYEFPKDLGFDVYWAQPEKKAKIDALLKDPDFYTRNKYTPELLEKVMERFEYINEVFHGQGSYNNLNILHEISIIKTPTLVIQGEFDYAIGVESGKMIYKALKSVPKKDKELVYIKNASHNLPSEEPQKLNESLQAFFKKNN
ncbi:alpha/beta fold hydrolase [Flavobacterium sp. HSC-61S13]|uniref:alpha/beta fold hydrolase n=1 Tax=Flavobacterium sp. HSC-61S13 TaxID=2910963 RepID=UPI00209EE76D|nr:alpha/beta fold hydrolase [Flavobacterium sp. HSC-61S13]MCP1994304.1 pimeloyl-ACP methyl ester carboxylesterase [Flavobacterium sp. HSC-61S13]